MADFDDHITALKQRRQDVLGEMTSIRTGNHPIYSSPEAVEKRQRELDRILLQIDAEIEAYKTHNEPEADEKASNR